MSRAGKVPAPVLTPPAREAVCVSFDQSRREQNAPSPSDLFQSCRLQFFAALQNPNAATCVQSSRHRRLLPGGHPSAARAENRIRDERAATRCRVHQKFFRTATPPIKLFPFRKLKRREEASRKRLCWPHRHHPSGRVLR